MKKILLIGDSIRQGYDKYVKMSFEGEADVVYSKDNCRFASYVLRCLPDWKEVYCGGEDVDLVHWNAGLWDSLVMLDGKHHTPIEFYKEYIERCCVVIKKIFPDAKVIFATSTPVQEHLFGDMKRFNADIEAYNAAAIETVTRYGHEINDLYTLMSACPASYHSDSTHFETEEGTKVITEKVVSAIEHTLGIKGKPLDYDVLFEKKNDIIGV